jgi:hypothetical protein
MAGRLAARRNEIEEAILARVYAVEDPAAIPDPDYIGGLRTAVSAGLSYGLSALGEDRAAPVPSDLLAQARRAAGAGVGLDTVLRRYLAAHTLLDDFIIEETQALGAEGNALAKAALRSEAALLDRLLDAVAAEYGGELEANARSWRRRSEECVRRLLAGEPTDVGGLDYDLGGWHLGAIAVGPEAEEALAEMARALDRRLLAVPGAEGVLWAWLGGVRRPDAELLGRLVRTSLPEGLCLALGEPAPEIAGWRLTHRQAAAALPIAKRAPGVPTRYGEVGMLASMMRDEVLAKSLQSLYLTPLEDEDGALRKTLRAYFAAERNVSCAAAALEVSRHTVAKRLKAVEERLGRPLPSCSAELEAALRLEEMMD